METTQKQIIKEIHESFYTEGDKLLASAKIANNSLDADRQYLIEKCERLNALGFINTKEVTEARAKIARLDETKRDSEAKKTLIDAINYFSFKYPNYKFITEDSVKKICKKYNLAYGPVDRYIGTVPDKNLKHIEDFKISENDEYYFEQFYRHSGITKKIKTPLEIVAPLKDFMTERYVNDDIISKVKSIDDPIVLKPVIFKEQKHYLIVTAWGIEAADDLVVNPNHN